MTTKPTEGLAIITKDGQTYRVCLSELIAHGQYDPDDGETIIPVTIIPTANLVQWAARVLLGAGLQRYHRVEVDEVDGELDLMGVMLEQDDGEYIAVAALRALAGAEPPPARDPVKEAAMVLLGALECPPVNGPTDWQKVWNEMTIDHNQSLDIAGMHDWPSLMIAALQALAWQGGE